ncbi:MAG: hypothetical protein M1834_002801 [Cirrosporium novae-zelandiae]|nr:MAG: hypothetical protein M1834_002801 [Cirrosporium novae-zelandiae]
MAPGLHDNLFWLGCGVAAFFAIKSIGSKLQELRELSEVKHDDQTKRLINPEETEDGTTVPMSTLAPYAEAATQALKLDSLSKLTEGSVYEIRTAALAVISDLSLKGPARRLLLRDLRSKDEDTRSNAISALRFLTQSAPTDALSNLETCTALVDCLVNLFDEHEPDPEPSSSNTANPSKYRQPIPPTEREAITVLTRFMGWSVDICLRAGLVKRWLANYPFAGVHGDKSRKLEIVNQLKTLKIEDTALGQIISWLHSESPEGRLQMREAGLIPENDEDGDIYMIGGEGTSGWGPSSSPPPRHAAPGRPRRDGESREEQSLRRRRREAMVIGEEGQPLGRDNIFQREMTPRDEAVERQLEQLMDEVQREDEAAAAPREEREQENTERHDDDEETVQPLSEV